MNIRAAKTEEQPVGQLDHFTIALSIHAYKKVASCWLFQSIRNYELAGKNI